MIRQSLQTQRCGLIQQGCEEPVNSSMQSCCICSTLQTFIFSYFHIFFYDTEVKPSSILVGEHDQEDHSKPWHKGASMTSVVREHLSCCSQQIEKVKATSNSVLLEFGQEGQQSVGGQNWSIAMLTYLIALDGASFLRQGDSSFELRYELLYHCHSRARIRTPGLPISSQCTMKVIGQI